MDADFSCEEANDGTSEWSETATQILLDLYLERKTKFFKSIIPKGELFAEMAHQMHNFGYATITAEKVELKLRELTQTYRSIKVQSKTKGEDNLEWPYYNYFESLYCGFQPKMTIKKNARKRVKSTDSNENDFTDKNDDPDYEPNNLPTDRRNSNFWSKDMKRALVKLYVARKSKYHNPVYKKKYLWLEIIDELVKLGFPRVEGTAISKHLRNMKRTFLIIQNNIKTRGFNNSSWEYYDDFKKFFTSDNDLTTNLRCKKEADPIKKSAKLIELVKKNPILYDNQTDQAKDYGSQMKIWKEIESKLNISGARNHWNFLRAQYKRHKVMIKDGQTKDENWKILDKLKFLDLLKNHDDSRFSDDDDDDDGDDDVDNDVNYSDDDEKINYNADDVEAEIDVKIEKEVDEEVETKTNGATDERVTDTEQMDPLDIPPYVSNNGPTDSSSQVKSRKRKHKNEDKSSKRLKTHPMEQFFSLMLESVKKFSVVDQHKVKTKVFSIVSEIEEQYLTVSAASPSSQSSCSSS